MTKWKVLNPDQYSENFERICNSYRPGIVPNRDLMVEVPAESAESGQDQVKPLVRSSWDGQPKKSPRAPVRRRNRYGAKA